MKTFTVRNTNSAMYPVYSWLSEAGVTQDSRNGKVLRAPCPVTITYTHPMERVNLCPVRDANPFFHLLEAMWMLSGSNVIAPLVKVLPRFVEYSDDGITQNAAYGHRARVKNGDQLKVVARILTDDPLSRQAVVQLWSTMDLKSRSVDKACNTQLMFSTSLSDRIDMMITNRSNDAIWGGVSGANVVHMAFFLEYVSALIGKPPGKIVVVSNNLHSYLDNPQHEMLFDMHQKLHSDPYEDSSVISVPLINADESVLEIDNYLSNSMGWCTPTLNEFLIGIFKPMLTMHTYWIAGEREKAFTIATKVDTNIDWLVAARNWYERRML